MKKIKNVTIAWISIYPAITLIMIICGDQLYQLPVALRTFALTIVLVPLMIYILIPFWTRVFDHMKSIHQGN